MSDNTSTPEKLLNTCSLKSGLKRRLIRRSLGGLSLLLVSGLCASAQSQPLQVSDADAKRAAIQKPAPTLTGPALQLKMTGHAEVRVAIDAEGKVRSAEPYIGSPLLTPACVEAVKKWKFKPFTREGARVEATAILAFDFQQ